MDTMYQVERWEIMLEESCVSLPGKKDNSHKNNYLLNIYFLI